MMHTVSLKLYEDNRDRAYTRAAPFLAELAHIDLEDLVEEHVTVVIAAEIYTDQPPARGMPTLANWVATVTYEWED